MQFILRFGCTKCRALLCFKNVQLYKSTSSASGNEITVDALQQLGFTESQAKQLLQKNAWIKKMKMYKLERLLGAMKKSGFSPAGLAKYPSLLRLSAATFDHYHNILEECGFSADKITLESITQYKFLNLMKMTPNELKEQGLIGEDIDVMRNIFSYSDLPSTVQVPETDNLKLLGLTQQEAIQYYLCWKLNTKSEEVEAMCKSYRSIHLKSIRLLLQIYNIMINNIGMPVEKIKKNAYLFQRHPEQYLDMLERVPTLGKKPIESLIVKMPKILLSTSETVLEILQTVKEYGLVEEDVATHPRVLTLSATTVRERLSHIHSDPIFKPFIHNRRRLKMVLHFHCAKNRTKMLNENKWRCSSFNFLSVGKKEFEERYKLGLDITRGFDTVIMLQKELSLTQKEIRMVLTKHPYWVHIPISTVARTLEYLQEAGVERSQITGCLQLLLYPMEDVQKQMRVVETSAEVDCCRDSSGKVRPELLLHLVLYFLERPYHFTGNGIWGDISPPELLS